MFRLEEIQGNVSLKCKVVLIYLLRMLSYITEEILFALGDVKIAILLCEFVDFYPGCPP